jgi:hypothetical protein
MPLKHWPPAEKKLDGRNRSCTDAHVITVALPSAAYAVRREALQRI